MGSGYADEVTKLVFRFSITRTFETFPMPNDFMVIGDGEGGRSSLRANPKSKQLSLLLEDFSLSSLTSSRDFSGWQRSRESSSGFHDDRSERDTALPELVGLQPDTSDLDVLERLVEMNRTAGM